jgi:hypothetical protein
MSEKSSQADWQGVGDSVKELGRKLKEHASDAQDAIKSTSAPLSGVAAQVGVVFKTGLAKLDETVSDPAIGTAARGATGKFLDALKVQLGAAQPAESSAEKPEPSAEKPEPSADKPEPAGVQPGDENPEGQHNNPRASPGA